MDFWIRLRFAATLLLLLCLVGASLLGLRERGRRDRDTFAPRESATHPNKSFGF